MSKKLFFILLLLSQSVTAQIVNIPDANFKAYLVGNTAINTNGDGEIQVAEAAAYMDTITVSFNSIVDMTGIEAFTALTYLDCGYNSLTSLDVTNNTNLTYMDCGFNSIPSLDFSNNTVLNYLDCSWNYFALISLDISQNTALTYLDCSFNTLPSLDLSIHTALTYLACDSNAFTTIDIKNGNNSSFTYFSASYNLDLMCINVDDSAYSATNWGKQSPQSYYSNNCLLTSTGKNIINQPSFTAYTPPV